MRGIVERIQREERNGQIRSVDGRAFHFDPDDLTDTTWDALLLGTKVDFEAGEQAASDGAKAREIRVIGEVTAIPPDEMPAWLNKNPDAAAMTTQVPPTSIEDSPQDQASWESFPASDSPAAGKST